MIGTFAPAGRLLSAILASASLTSVALAQTPGAPDTPFPSEPIVARHLDSRALQRLGIVQTGVEVGRAPGVVAVTGPGGSSTRLFARGLGAADPLADPAVATIVDGVPLPTAIANDFPLFDPASLSVATGPFGTTSGPQALAGVVAVRSALPGERVGGFVEAGWGQENRWLLRGSVDLPMADGLAFKLSTLWRGGRGFAHNLTTGERVNDADMSGIRLAARVQPVDGVDWNLAAAYVENNGENLLNFACKPAGVSGCRRYLTTGLSTRARLGGVAQYAVPVTGRKADFPLGSEVKTTLLTSRLTWDAGAVSLLAVTGHVRTNIRQALDFSDGRMGPSRPAMGYATGGDTQLLDGRLSRFTQELRASGQLGALSLVAGGWYSSRSDRLDAARWQTADDGTAQGHVTGLTDRIDWLKTREQALFAQANYAGPLFEAKAGLRYSDLGQGVGRISQHRHIWAPSAELAVVPLADTRLFVRSGRGYQAGSADDLTPFTTTVAWTHEAGVATSLAGGRLHVALTGFLLNADDVATAEWLGPPRPAADLRNHGAELELTARPTDQLALWANVGWQHARYRGPAAAGGIGPVYAPAVTASGGAFYDLFIPWSGVILTPTIELRYRGKMATDLVTRVGNTLRADASLAVRTDDGAWTLALECRNCLNDDDADSSLLGWTYPVQPRSWMLRARRNF